MTEPLSPAEARRILGSTDSQVALLDVREPLEYTRGQIPESTPVPRGELEFRLPAVVPNGAATILLVDREGDRADRDADWLEYLGYDDVRYVGGGMAAWETAGFETIEAHDGVPATASNYPSKDFGERVQAEESVEQIRPSALKDRIEADAEDLLVADVRTREEFESGTIPGAVNLEGVDVGLYLQALRDEDQTVVVNCGGRTRSIIGTSSLRKLGYENVLELENGTMGWDLAGYDLERGADRRITDLDVDADARARIRAHAVALLDDTDVSLLSVGEFEDRRRDERETVYAVDVRTPEEYAAGHIPDTLSIPGGQAIQTTEKHFAVRNGTIAFVSEDHVRAAITAYWFDRMGFPSVTVLEGGIEAWQDEGGSLDTGPHRPSPRGKSTVEAAVSTVSPAALADRRSAPDTLVVDVDTSERFRDGHVPDATWVPRYELDGWLARSADPDTTVVLTSREGERAAYAAAAVERFLDLKDVSALAGGTAAWAESGRSLTGGDEGMAFEPADVVPKPYHQGDWAKRTYLEWEERLGEKYG